MKLEGEGRKTKTTLVDASGCLAPCVVAVYLSHTSINQNDQ